MRRLLGFLSVLVSVIVAIAISEFALTKIGIHPVGSLLARPPKPAPGQLRVALFGESAAEAAVVEKSFAEPLALSLSGRKQTPVHISVFARRGQGFHGMQSELALLSIPDYDLLVIYAGNNEFRVHLDDTGSARKPEYRWVRDFEPVRREVRWPFYSYIKEHSRAFAVLLRSWEFFFPTPDQ